MDEVLDRCVPKTEGSCVSGGGDGLVDYCPHQIMHLIDGYEITQEQRHMDGIKKLAHCNFHERSKMPTTGMTMGVGWLAQQR